MSGSENIFGFLWIGSELKVEVSNRNAGGHLAHPNCSGPITAEVMVWLPALVAEVAVGQSIIFIYVLANAYLYIQSVTAPFLSYTEKDFH